MNEMEYMRFYYLEWFMVIAIFFGLIIWIHLVLVKKGFVFSTVEDKKSSKRTIHLLLWILILELFIYIPFTFVTDTFGFSSNLGIFFSPLVLSYSIYVIDRVLLKGLFKGSLGIIAGILSMPYIIFNLIDTFSFAQGPPKYVLYVVLISYVFIGLFLILIISLIIVSMQHKLDKSTCIFAIFGISFLRIVPFLYYTLSFLIFGPSTVENLFLNLFINQTVTFGSEIIGFSLLILAIYTYTISLEKGT